MTVIRVFSMTSVAEKQENMEKNNQGTVGNNK